jgi:hypothetical protein
MSPAEPLSLLPVAFETVPDLPTVESPVTRSTAPLDATAELAVDIDTTPLVDVSPVIEIEPAVPAVASPLAIDTNPVDTRRDFNSAI